MKMNVQWVGLDHKIFVKCSSYSLVEMEKILHILTLLKNVHKSYSNARIILAR